MKRKIQYVDLNGEQLKTSYEKYGMNGWLIKALLELDEVTRKGYLANVTDDVLEVLGRQPISFGDFIQDHRSVFSKALQAGAPLES